MSTRAEHATLSSDLVGIEAALAESVQTSRQWNHGGLGITLVETEDDAFLCFTRDCSGGLALRVPKIVGSGDLALREPDGGAIVRWTVTGPAGKLDVRVSGDPTGHAQFHCCVTVTPSVPLRLAAQPRDLVAFGRTGNPLSSKGSIEAQQRKMNTGLCYFRIDQPDIGKVLYVQNLTALNPYFAATGTKPESTVGGDWPELGYRIPVDPSKSLPPGEPICLYDTHLVFRRFAEEAESESAWQFLDMLAAVYCRIEKPDTELRPWIERAKRTLRDLEKAPKTRTWHYGEVYFHPYTNAEYPDSMVQLSLLSAVYDWGIWRGRKHPLYARIQRGLAKFHDSKLGTLRRYLPDVGADKNADAVDSWYLYHPLVNLSNMAISGDAKARDLFLATVDYGIKAARHFDYKWPIQFDAKNFKVITAVAPADRRGQTDVGGIYAWVMLQAFQLTGETRFINEARAALDSARGLRFDLNYQANLTAWGAAACIRLWRITEEKTYLALSYAYLASFFHNAQIWESEIGVAANLSNFMGVTCLQDAPYMAIYECFDSYAAFERFLDLGGPDLIPSARLLVSEYCRYALHRAWFYYPDALPPEALAEKQRNGEIDPSLSYPLEDLYPDGQPCGQVGQEIYGAGAAMVFASRAFHRIEGASFILFCDHFIRALSRVDEHTVSFRVDGEDGGAVRLLVLRDGRNKLPKVVLSTLDGKPIASSRATPKSLEFDLPVKVSVQLHW
jgi:hypothetical protein